MVVGVVAALSFIIDHESLLLLLLSMSGEVTLTSVCASMSKVAEADRALHGGWICIGARVKTATYLVLTSLLTGGTQLHQPKS